VTVTKVALDDLVISLSSDLRDGAIDEPRRFRHRFRKRYDEGLEVDKLHPVIKSAVAAWPRIRANLATWEAWVIDCAKIAQ
jgi:hypothetical protein